MDVCVSQLALNAKSLIQWARGRRKKNDRNKSNQAKPSNKKLNEDINSPVDNMEYKAEFEVDLQVSHVKDDIKVILKIF